MEDYPTFSSDEQLALMQMLADAVQAVQELSPQSDALSNLNDSNEFGAVSIDQMGLIEDMFRQFPLAVTSTECSTVAFGSVMTTLMMRNIPRRCTQRMLMADVIATGYGNSVDFVYLPTDISSGRNLGYAFVNFLKPEFAECFRESFHKKHLSAMRGSRAGLSVSFAVIQGLEANLENVLKTASVHRIRNPEYLPLVLDSEGRLAPCNLAKRSTSPPALFNVARRSSLVAH